MDTNPSHNRRAESLIPPPRQLKAALRKSAERAQRLADAFGLQVPSASVTPRISPTKNTSKR